jgi:hypothetical protein
MDPDSLRLLNILKDEDASHAFMEFLDESKCAENLFFWKEVEKYKTLFQQLSDPAKSGVSRVGPPTAILFRFFFFSSSFSR